LNSIFFSHSMLRTRMYDFRLPHGDEDFQIASVTRGLPAIILQSRRDIHLHQIILEQPRGTQQFILEPTRDNDLHRDVTTFPRLPRVLSEVFCSDMETAELLIP
jgi:hypothetical protein